MGDPDASPSWGLYQAWGFPIRYLSRAGELNELGMMTWGWIPFEWTRFVLNQLVNHNLFLNVAWNCGLNPTPPFSDTPGWSAGRVICPWAPCDLSFSMQCIGMQTRPQLGQVGQVDCKRSEHFLSCNIIYIYIWLWLYFNIDLCAYMGIQNHIWIYIYFNMNFFDSIDSVCFLWTWKGVMNAVMLKTLPRTRGPRVPKSLWGHLGIAHRFKGKSRGNYPPLKFCYGSIFSDYFNLSII